MPLQLLRGTPAVLLLTLWCLAWTGSACAETRKPAASLSEAQGEGLPSMLQRYAAAQRVALKEQVCLAEASCVTDKARLLEALETSRRVLQAMAALAESGDPEAAYQRGMLSLEVMEKHVKRSTAELVLRSPAQSARLRQLIAAEAAIAQRYLGQASQAGHAAACRAMASHMQERVPPSEPPLVARLYLCAVRGFVAQGRRVAALETFASMQGNVAPTSMELVEAYVLLFRSKAPDRELSRIDAGVVIGSAVQGLP